MPTATRAVLGSPIFRPTSMGDIYGRAGRLLDDLRALPQHRRRVAIEALHWVTASPEPDGISKREAPPFPRRGVIEAIYDSFVIIYMIDTDGVLFLRVQERTDLSIEE